MDDADPELETRNELVYADLWRAGTPVMLWPFTQKILQSRSIFNYGYHPQLIENMDCNIIHGKPMYMDQLFYNINYISVS